MGVEAIVRVVEAEAAAEAERIVGAASARARDLVTAAESAAADRIRAACDRADPAYRADAMRHVNAARVQLLERRASLAAERVDAVARAAAERLAAICATPGDPRWSAGLARLVAETAEIVGPDGRIVVRATDADDARPIAARAGCRLDTGSLGVADDPLAAGVVGWSADARIEVDATLRARLGRARTDHAESIVGLLGVGA